MHTIISERFSLGIIAITANARDKINPAETGSALARHAQGNWGDLGEEDREENELALEQGFRLFSRYLSADGVRFWIITEADRSVTTVLLPEDY